MNTSKFKDTVKLKSCIKLYISQIIGQANLLERTKENDNRLGQFGFKGILSRTGGAKSVGKTAYRWGGQGKTDVCMSIGRNGFKLK